MHTKHKGSLKDTKDILCQEKKIGDIGQCQWYNSTFQVDSNMSFTVNIVYKNFSISKSVYGIFKVNTFTWSSELWKDNFTDGSCWTP